MTEVRFPFDYDPWASPGQMRIALLGAGYEPPVIGTACDLGFGEGGNIVISAASGTARWFGTDVNAAHHRRAQALADAAGIPIRIRDDAFVEYGAREDLPTFDFVVVNGVWSWISDRSRAAIVEFCRHRLRPGGVLYLQYLALPGDALLAPVKHLLAQFALRGSDGSLHDRLRQAFDGVERLLDARTTPNEEHRRIRDGLNAIRQVPPEDLIHDMLGQHRRPSNFSEVASSLGEAGLVHVAQAGYVSSLDALIVDPAQRRILESLTEPVLRESVADFMVNRLRRADYWVKTPAARTGSREDLLRLERVILVAEKATLPFEIRAPLLLQGRGPVDSTAAMLLAVLADRRARSLGEIESAMPSGTSLSAIVEATCLLLACNVVAAAQVPDAIAAARPAAERLNAVLLAEGAAGNGSRYLASPVLGGGFRLRLPEQAFLQAWRSGDRSIERWVRKARALRRTSTGGRPVTRSPDDLAARASSFAEVTLPVLRSLLVA